MAKLPKIINVSDIGKGKLDFQILHFTKAQWKKAVDQVAFSNNISELPKKEMLLHGIPNPDGSVNVFPGCPEHSPDTICIVKNKLNPDGSMTMQCQCRPRKIGDDVPSPPGGGRPTLPACIGGIRKGRLECIKGSCTRNCRLRGVQVGNLFYLYCSCGA